MSRDILNVTSGEDVASSGYRPGMLLTLVNGSPFKLFPVFFWHVSPFCSSEEGGFLVSTIYLFSQPQRTQKFSSKLLVDTSAKHKFISQTNLCLKFFFL